MIYLYSLLGLMAAGLLYMRVEAGLLQIHRIQLTKSKKCLRILQLSDIHINHLKVRAHKVKQGIQSEKPDLIVVTGDFIEKPHHSGKFLKFLSEIQTGIPMYLCLGNHDYKAFLKDKQGLRAFISSIEMLGVKILHNRSVCIEKNSRKYNIIGIADMRYNHHDLDIAFSECSKDACMNIAFSHNPDIALEIPRGKADYLLCGHFHGGQIWMPFNLEFKLLRDEKLCKMGIRRGLHKVNGINLYINRGLGSVLFPLRFFSIPEITVFDLP